MPAQSFEDANAFHRAMRRLASTKAGRVVFRPTAHRLDRMVSAFTGGRFSFAGIAAGLPAVLLTTTGAKSGRPRTVALLGIPHPAGIAVAAANYGGDRHPGWYYNLMANPSAAVTLEADTWNATARLATHAERERLWRDGVDIYPGLAAEQEWAGQRRIEVFILERS